MKMREQIRTLIAPEWLPLLHSFFLSIIIWNWQLQKVKKLCL